MRFVTFKLQKYNDSLRVPNDDGTTHKQERLDTLSRNKQKGGQR